MKRFLALLLTLVMLVSICGLQAFAADGDTPADTGDELVVYTRSGATRICWVETWRPRSCASAPRTAPGCMCRGS